MEHGNSTSTSADDANTMDLYLNWELLCDLYLLGIIGIVVLIWFAFGVLGQLVEKMIIWIYPAYCSILVPGPKDGVPRGGGRQQVAHILDLPRHCRCHGRSPCQLSSMLLAGQVPVHGVVHAASGEQRVQLYL